MGRASRIKQERRQERARSVATVKPATGGRPRKYADDAARQRAYRLRKRTAAVAQAQLPAFAEDASAYDVDPWLASPEHSRWLSSTADVLGDEWLTFALDVEAEVSAEDWP